MTGAALNATTHGDRTREISFNLPCLSACDDVVQATIKIDEAIGLLDFAKQLDAPTTAP